MTHVLTSDRRFAAVALLSLKRLLYCTLVAGLLVLAIALSAAVVPRLFGYGTLIVTGGSMGDSIPNGALVIARWMPSEEVQLGDAILLREQTPDGLAPPKLHRVFWLGEEGGQRVARAKGDANQTPDPNVYVLPPRVLTPAITVPYLGYLSGFAKSPLGFLLLIAVPAVFVSFAALRGIWLGDAKPDMKTGTVP